jgi:hypothetical protein
VAGRMRRLGRIDAVGGSFSCSQIGLQPLWVGGFLLSKGESGRFACDERGVL